MHSLLDPISLAKQNQKCRVELQTKNRLQLKPKHQHREDWGQQTQPQSAVLKFPGLANGSNSSKSTVAIQEVACYESWCTRVISFNFFFIIVLFIALNDLILDMFFSKIKNNLLLLIYFWLCWVFTAASGPSHCRTWALERRLSSCGLWA